MISGNMGHQQLTGIKGQVTSVCINIYKDLIKIFKYSAQLH